MARGILISWIGHSDLRADLSKNDPGPVLRLLRRETFDAVHLLNDIPPHDPAMPR